MVMRTQGRSCAGSCEAVIQNRNTAVDSQTDHTHTLGNVRTLQQKQNILLLNKDCRHVRIRSFAKKTV